MKIKVRLLIVAIILASIVFGISIYMQKKIVNYEATVSCLILTRDINENEPIDKDSFKLANVPISIVATQKIVTNFKEIEGLYAKDNIKQGQIAIRNQFDTKENLSIYEAEEGKEKISIKIKNSENGMSFQIKEKSHINVYATIRNEFADGFLEEYERMIIGTENEGYTVIKILDNVEVIGVFTIDGIEYDKSDEENMDTILISVTPKEAQIINLIRDISTFNITGIKYNKEQIIENVITEISESITSGDEL